LRTFSQKNLRSEAVAVAYYFIRSQNLDTEVGSNA